MDVAIAYIVMASVVMAYTVMAFVVTANLGDELYSSGGCILVITY